VARLNADGTLDPAFDPRPNTYTYGLAVQPDGKVLIAGSFTTLQPTGGAVLTNHPYLARLNADGTLDAAFDPRPDNNVNWLAVQADASCCSPGDFTAFQPNGGTLYNRSSLARLNADGTVDTGFAPNPDGPVQSLALQADGKILCGGGFQNVAGVQRAYFARLNANGALDTSFDPRPNYWVYGVAQAGGWEDAAGRHLQRAPPQRLGYQHGDPQRLCPGASTTRLAASTAHPPALRASI